MRRYVNQKGPEPSVGMPQIGLPQVPYHRHYVKTGTTGKWGGTVSSGPIMMQPPGGTTLGPGTIQYPTGTDTTGGILPPPVPVPNPKTGPNMGGYSKFGCSGRTQRNLWFNQTADTDTGAPLGDSVINNNILNEPITTQLPPEGPILLAGDTVQRADGVLGTATGVANRMYPPGYEINWDDGTTSTPKSAEVFIVSQGAVSEIQPELIQPVQAGIGGGLGSTKPADNGCPENHYLVPGVEKCLDRTVALVLGAVALYIIFNKNIK